MENYVSIFIPLALLAVLLRILVLPVRWFWKIFVNSACGFVCLWLLNSIAAFTGILFPVKSVTVLIAGFLGLPGIILLAILQGVL